MASFDVAPSTPPIQSPSKKRRLRERAIKRRLWGTSRWNLHEDNMCHLEDESVDVAAELNQMAVSPSEGPLGEVPGCEVRVPARHFAEGHGDGHVQAIRRPTYPRGVRVARGPAKERKKQHEKLMAASEDQKVNQKKRETELVEELKKQNEKLMAKGEEQNANQKKHETEPVEEQNMNQMKHDAEMMEDLKKQDEKLLAKSGRQNANQTKHEADPMEEIDFDDALACLRAFQAALRSCKSIETVEVLCAEVEASTALPEQHPVYKKLAADFCSVLKRCTSLNMVEDLAATLGRLEMSACVLIDADHNLTMEEKNRQLVGRHVREEPQNMEASETTETRVQNKSVGFRLAPMSKRDMAQPSRKKTKKQKKGG